MTQDLTIGICAEWGLLYQPKLMSHLCSSALSDRLGSHASYASIEQIVLYTSRPGGPCLEEHTLYAPRRLSQSPAMCHETDGSGARRKLSWADPCLEALLRPGPASASPRTSPGPTKERSFATHTLVDRGRSRLSTKEQLFAPHTLENRGCPRLSV